MRIHWKGALLALPLSLTLGCDKIMQYLPIGGAKTEAAEAALKDGDLPGAAGAYDEAVQGSPTAVDVATGAAFMAVMQGDHDGADGFLAAAEADAGERLGEIKMRRALVALEAGDLDAVREHGEASGMSVGQLLAAEVLLADGEREDAANILDGLSGESGQVGDVAGEYLALINSEDPLVAGLSEAQALWALGEQKVAVRSVEDLVKALPEDAGRDEQLLVWASRAASVGETEVARSLLGALIFPPEGQAWRKVATQAIIACADGEADTCQSLFVQLEGNAPADGLADAKATAAFLIAGSDADAAKALAGPHATSASARALAEAGDMAGARDAADGVLGRYLGGG